MTEQPRKPSITVTTSDVSRIELTWTPVPNHPPYSSVTAHRRGQCERCAAILAELEALVDEADDAGGNIGPDVLTALIVRNTPKEG